MVDDIRILTNFVNHPKRKRLKRKLGEGYLDYLLDLWIAVALNRPSGVLHGWTHEDIADYAGWEGDANVFVQALHDTRWLDVHSRDEGNVYKCHDWPEHQPWVVGAEARKDKARLAALIKNHGKKKGVKLFYGGKKEQETPELPSVLQCASCEHASSMQEKPVSIPQACLEQCGEHAPILSFPFPKKTSSKNRFDDFWAAYPKKKEKKKCKAKWKTRKLDHLADMIIADIVNRLKNDRQWLEGFVPNPLTYINGDRWEDDIELRETEEGKTIIWLPEGMHCSDCETYPGCGTGPASRVCVKEKLSFVKRES